jgi:aspartate carbamoyltransferase regulatory subunit
VDPNITVSVIKDGVTVEKKKVDLPEQIVNIVKCKNPRCITTTEQGIKQIFKLTDREKRTYRCVYCEAENQGETIKW